MLASYPLPARWSGIQISTVADYTDGLAFSRELLIPGLPQGPFLVPATVRGSPEGGNRTQYLLNWNLRVMREFALYAGRMAISVDILNVTNAGQALQQSDLTGPSFNLRLPVVIQSPCFLRMGARYSF